LLPPSSSFPTDSDPGIVMAVSILEPFFGQLMKVEKSFVNFHNYNAPTHCRTPV